MNWKNPALIALLVSLGLIILMPSTQSIWIDEAYNARFATTENFSGFVDLFLSGKFSENQMPFSMLYSWMGGRLIGTSEWQLRAINILWGFLGVFSFYWMGKVLKIWWLPLLFAVHPFVWHYMNEARPYAMQLGCSSLLAAGLVGTITRDSRLTPIWALCIGGLILCTSSLLGVLPFGAIALAYAFWMWWRRLVPERLGWILLSSTFAILLGLGLFYLWTLSRGAGGAKLWKLGLPNFAFSTYELLGFSGLGPSRQALREAATAGMPAVVSLIAPYAKGLLFLVLAYLALALTGVRSVLKGNRHTAIALTMVLVSIGGFFIIAALSYTQSFPFWGRHLAPILPFMLVAISAFLADTNISTSALRYLLLCLLAVSSFQLRYSSNYPKDAYRDAGLRVAEARAKNQKVAWFADRPSGQYYQVPAPLLSGPTELDLTDVPDVVIIGTPEIYDADGSVRGDAERSGLFLEKRLPGILIYSRTGNSQP